MAGWYHVLKIVGICAILAVFLFVAVGPTSYEFRLLLGVISDFAARVVWPLAVVAIVYILREPLMDLVRRGTGKMQGGSGSSKPSDHEER
jgi:hypothetical protein